MPLSFKAEVLEMCNLGQAVEMTGVKKGIEKGIEMNMLECIKNLMETMNLSLQEAMDALKIPQKNQARYATKLNTDN